MPTSTYMKEWKNRFIFVLPSLVPESLPLRDPATIINDGIPALSAAETMLWKKMYEHPTRAFNFLEGILAMGGLSPLYPIRPKAFHENKVISSVHVFMWKCHCGTCCKPIAREYRSWLKVLLIRKSEAFLGEVLQMLVVLLGQQRELPL
ncbi:hypothetical protein HanOQP8_Chr11g0420681 [Helianthus annuus]|nr:hypothetical protein HanLR1_Chr11g0419761 [Helianthus annuus]KAJ0690692.1 hypothetical protein HanOQP8_Chr11g0420681 [Helianthus annuus]KAJ0876691.1 hypothetical protein HanPSC8_Chr11g0491381 [Helianthus annuus]